MVREKEATLDSGVSYTEREMQMQAHQRLGGVREQLPPKSSGSPGRAHLHTSISDFRPPDCEATASLAGGPLACSLLWLPSAGSGQAPVTCRRPAPCSQGKGRRGLAPTVTRQAEH